LNFEVCSSFANVDAQSSVLIVPFVLHRKLYVFFERNDDKDRFVPV
jgi:hypothetical protein